jgi:cytochrome c1
MSELNLIPEMKKTIKIRFAEGDIQAAKEAIYYCLGRKQNPQTMFSAAKLVIEHERDMYKHENPATQKTRLEHEFINELKIKGVVPGESNKTTEDMSRLVAPFTQEQQAALSNGSTLEPSIG